MEDFFSCMQGRRAKARQGYVGFVNVYFKRLEDPDFAKGFYIKQIEVTQEHHLRWRPASEVQAKWEDRKLRRQLAMVKTGDINFKGAL